MSPKRARFETDLPSGKTVRFSIPEFVDFQRTADSGDVDSLIRECVDIANAPGFFASLDLIEHDKETLRAVVEDCGPKGFEIQAAVDAIEVDPLANTIAVRLPATDRHPDGSIVVVREPTTKITRAALASFPGKVHGESCERVRLCLLSVDGKAIDYVTAKMAWPLDIKSSLILRAVVDSRYMPSAVDVGKAKGSIRLVE